MLSGTQVRRAATKKVSKCHTEMPTFKRVGIFLCQNCVEINPIPIGTAIDYGPIVN